MRKGPPASRETGRARSAEHSSARRAFLELSAAGWVFSMVVMVGADLYSYGRWPTFADFVLYVAVSLLLAPMGGVVIGLKAGWVQEWLGWRRVITFLVVVVIVGVIIAALV